MRFNRFCCLVLTLLVIGSATPLFSQMVKAEVQVKLILKIISFDRNIGRFGDPIKIGCSSDKMFAVIKSESNLKIKGKAFTVGKLETLDDIDKYNILYIDKNWEDNYKAACEKAIKHQALMFAASNLAVEAGNAAVAFKTVKGKPKIVMHLGIVIKMGTNFPANLLQLTMIVGNL
ncbi:MAG: DUF4154 domain-containing protein [bacterium]|nr:DUF4154 domain-containing protein [bacterium]